MKISPSQISFPVFVVMPCSHWLNEKSSESVKKKVFISWLFFSSNILNAVHDFLSDVASICKR